MGPSTHEIGGVAVAMGVLGAGVRVGAVDVGVSVGDTAVVGDCGMNADGDAESVGAAVEFGECTGVAVGELRRPEPMGNASGDSVDPSCTAPVLHATKAIANVS